MPRFSNRTMRMSGWRFADWLSRLRARWRKVARNSRRSADRHWFCQAKARLGIEALAWGARQVRFEPRRRVGRTALLEPLEQRWTPARYVVMTSGDDTNFTPVAGTGTAGN